MAIELVNTYQKRWTKIKIQLPAVCVLTKRETQSYLIHGPVPRELREKVIFVYIFKYYCYIKPYLFYSVYNIKAYIHYYLINKA
jgi:hypothetical protein